MAHFLMLGAALLALTGPTIFFLCTRRPLFQKDRKKGTGVYGWLFVFVVYALYLGPLFVAAVAWDADAASLEALAASARDGQRQAVYLLCLVVSMFAGMFLTVAAGMLVVARAPRAPGRIRLLLTLRAGIDAAVWCGLPWLIFSHGLAAQVVNHSATGALVSVGIQAAWVLYFARSRQVARTFGEAHR